MRLNSLDAIIQFSYAVSALHQVINHLIKCYSLDGNSINVLVNFLGKQVRAEER